MNTCSICAHKLERKVGRTLLLLLVFTLSTFSLHAQTAILEGSITDAYDDMPLIGATVQIVGTSIGSVTDLDGQYHLELEPGKYLLLYSYVGQSPQRLEVELEEGQVIIKHISLSPEMGTEAIVTDSKNPKDLNEAVSSVNVIPKTEIENRNDPDLGISLRNNPGTQVIGGQVDIRGASGFAYGAGSRVLFVVDGLPMLRGDSQSPELDFMPIEIISGIEVSKGPASALFGASALGGVVYLSSDYATQKPVTKLSLSSGLYQNPYQNALNDSVNKAWWNGQYPTESNLSFVDKRKLGKIDLIVGGNFFSRDGYKQSDFSRRGRLNASTRYLKYNKDKNTYLTLRIAANVQKSTSGNHLIWNGDAEKKYELWSGLTPMVNRSTKLTLDPSIKYEWAGKGLAVEWKNRWYRSQTANNTQQGSGTDLLFSELSIRKILNDKLTLNAGLNASSTQVDAELFGDQSLSSSNQSFYAQLEAKPLARLSVVLGARYEKNTMEEQSEGLPVFRLGSSYQLAEGTFLRFSAGQGYRFPSIAETYVETLLGSFGTMDIKIFPNLDLASEQGLGLDLGLRQLYKRNQWSGYLDASLFFNRYDNMIEFAFTNIDGDLGFQAQNVGDTEVKGLDVSLATQRAYDGGATRFMAAYTFIDPRYQEFTESIQGGSSSEENVLKYRFRHALKLGAESEYGKFLAGFSARYNSHMDAVDRAFLTFIPGLADYRNANQSGEFVTDIRLIYQLTDQTRVSLICNNALNNEYTIRPALIEAPRSYFLKLDVKL